MSAGPGADPKKSRRSRNRRRRRLRMCLGLRTWPDICLRTDPSDHGTHTLNANVISVAPVCTLQWCLQRPAAASSPLARGLGDSPLSSTQNPPAFPASPRPHAPRPPPGPAVADQLCTAASNGPTQPGSQVPMSATAHLTLPPRHCSVSLRSISPRAINDTRYLASAGATEA